MVLISYEKYINFVKKIKCYHTPPFFCKFCISFKKFNFQGGHTFCTVNWFNNCAEHVQRQWIPSASFVYCNTNRFKAEGIINVVMAPNIPYIRGHSFDSVVLALI